MKIMIVVIGIIIFILILAPTYFYWNQFHGNSLSDNHQNWGEFGDYFGGVLNPIISFLSLIATLYIAFIANKIQKRQIQPYGNIILNDYENIVGIDIHNAGLGTLIIDDVVIKDNKDKIYKNILHAMPSLPSGESWTNFIEELQKRAISPGDRINIIKLEIDFKKPEIENKVRLKFRDDVRKRLQHLTIELIYSDILNENQKPVKRTLEFFGRHF